MKTEQTNEISEVEKLKAENKLLLDKLAVAKAESRLSEKTIKSTNCKTFASYHFSMSSFKNTIFKMFNKNVLNTAYIVKDTEQELEVTKDFKEYFCDLVNKDLIEKYNL